MSKSNKIRLPLALAIAICASATSALELSQELFLGFPIDGIYAALPYQLPDEQHHRVAVAHPAYLLGLQWLPESNTYEQRFFVQGDFNGRVGLALADVDGDGANDIVVLDSFRSNISAWNATTGAPLAPMNLNVAQTEAVAAQDVDGMPGDELILTNRRDVSAYKAGVLLWQHPTTSTVKVTTGGRASSRRDIIISSAEGYAVLDAGTGVERIRHPLQCFGAAVGQSDFDASLEIACFLPEGLSLVDADSGTVQWTAQEHLYAVSGVTMVDANGDARLDVAVRTYSPSNGLLAVYDGATGLMFTTPRELDAGGFLVPADVDCASALLVLEGGLTTAQDKLHLVDAMTLTTRSAYSFDVYGIKGIAVADMDGDGRNELLARHHDTTSTISIQPYAVNHVVGGSSCCSYVGLAAGQLDADPASEYVVAGYVSGYTGGLAAYDGVTHSVMWVAQTDDAEAPRGVDIADVNRDGQRDVITATAAVHSGAKGQFVYAFDGATGRMLWRTPNVPGLRSFAQVADVDADGAPDVLALSSTVGILQFDGVKGTLRTFDEFTGGSAFAVLNADTDPELEFVVATEGHLSIRDHGLKTEEVTLDDAGAPRIKVADVDGDGVDEILLLRGETSSEGVRLEVRARDLKLLWRSESFPRLPNFQQENLIAVADVDNDGAAEVLVTSSLGVRIFRVGALRADTVPPRFAAGAALVSQAEVTGPCCASVHLRWDGVENDASPRITYEIYRVGASSQQREVRIGTTWRTEFIDTAAGGAMHYRYVVRARDEAGNTSVESLTADVPLPASKTCRRRSVRK